MATSANAKIQFESGQTLHDYAAMTDSGDHKIHTISGGTIFSGKSGFEPVIRPNGIVTGRNLLSVNATNDTVTIAAFTAYSEGTLYSVDATTDTITRSSGDVAKINSITMTDAGVIAVVAGTDGASAAFSETRGAAGGPPEIPADSVELGQIRTTTEAAAVIAADEIFQVVGTHAERFDYPTWTVNPIGDGDAAAVSAKKNAYIEFASELPAIHASAAYKQVYIRYYAPIFTEVQKGSDFVPAENSHSVYSTQYYNGTIASVSSSLGQASFTALMDDNVTDALIGVKDTVVTIRQYPDRNKTPYTLTQGKLGISRSFPVADQNSASVTISAENATAGFAS
jgi:hypothetical protein